jgi:hypothetical protein
VPNTANVRSQIGRGLEAARELTPTWYQNAIFQVPSVIWQKGSL